MNWGTKTFVFLVVFDYKVILFNIMAQLEVNATQDIAVLARAMATKIQNVIDLTVQVTAMKNNINNLIQQVGGNNAPASFALSPGLTAVDELINYRTKYSAAVY